MMGARAPPETVIADFHKCLDVMLLKQAHTDPRQPATLVPRERRANLAFTDDDCEPAADWLQTLAKRFTATPDCAIGGKTLNNLPRQPVFNGQSNAHRLPIAYYNADPLQARFFASNNMALPSERFHMIGGFDTTFPIAAGEDRELCDRGGSTTTL